MSEEISDIRYQIFEGHMGARVTGALISEGEGVVSGIDRARKLMEEAGILFSSPFVDGSYVNEGEEIIRVTGNPVQIALAEEQIIGALSKSSGIATAARRALNGVSSSCQVVSGAWKKMPLQIKDLIRQAALDGGIQVRISDVPFVYLDKNYVRILGGVKEAVLKGRQLGRAVVVQIRGETKNIGDEAVEAALSGAKIVMVDTGRQKDLTQVVSALKAEQLRSRVRIAFAGDLTLDDLYGLAESDLDIVDIGYAIMDAPCLPMRFDVTEIA
jgi:nicotinate-nucleotide pyrophosphorylase (carboxylating)